MKDGGTAYAVADLVTLVNNAMLYLFNEVCLQLGGQEIETLRYLGQSSTTMKVLLNDNNFSTSMELSRLWAKDSTNTAANTITGFAAHQSWISQIPTDKGRFQVEVPPKAVFGFANDYTKIVMD